MKTSIYAAGTLFIAAAFYSIASAQTPPAAEPQTAEKPAEAAAPAGLNWIDNTEEVLKLAKEQNKAILIDFTGSDWCGWCIRLKKEVFNTPEFEAFAKEHLILQVADFPNRKPISDAVKQQNRALAQKYGIEGFPTLIILNSDGQQVGRMGYMPGGPAPFIAELQKVISK